MPDTIERDSIHTPGQGRSMRTIAVIAGLILVICVVFGGLFGAAQFIG